MSERSQVLCKYHISGACRFGSDCAFSHNLSDLPSQVCKFYLAGNCAYGDRCRYDHRRPDWSKAGQLRQQQQQHVQPAQPHASSAGAAGPSSRALRGDPYVAVWDAREPTDPSRLPPALAAAAAAASPSGPAPSGPGAAPSATASRGPAWGLAAGAKAPVATGAAAGRAAGGGGGAEPADEWEHVAEAVAAAEAAEAAAAAGRRGLVLIDDDVGLEQEARRLEQERGQRAAEGAGARPSVVSGAAAAAAGAAGAAGSLPWSPDLDPWDQRGGAGGEREAGGEEGYYDPYYDEYGEYGEGEEGHEGEEQAGYEAGGEEGQEGPAGQGAGWWSGAGAGAGAGGEAVDPADLELCPAFALHGRCAEGEDCPLIHGLECETCHKWRIHPYNEAAAAEHAAECRLRHARLEARLRSADVECGICLEHVMHKPSVSDRRFGLMDCDHAFCLACIRSWRERNTDASLATDTAVRTCPICRTCTHFVTPSLVWPATAEEKEAIVGAYKAKLGTIDCRHFAFGDGTCPFSTSCFYRHAYRDGRLEVPVLRRAGNADGEVRVVAPLRLSAFLDTPQAQRLLGGRRR
ncbi:hypothetical protein CHLRE_06g278136v5 [Chlamydomonas reinhardtii]|uniref:Uncharacterized protein n=1 Tax=Chlamydomonas reinhardtii TaxID=3055 RepID=A0A2K3DNY2_CHLRE|nr:uncharacterized protein CHLRE_06g278136v5 [Chlamydomonas reinhardtii]PNW82246.1 hypothetical protein CHLRE_06g278136v5 [Chlamydomonas reinhardtii]